MPEANSPAAIASGGTLIFDCTSTLWLTGKDIASGSISIDWEIVASIDGEGSVAILPPLTDEWIASTNGVARVSLAGLDHGLYGDAPEAMNEREIAIAYRLRIERSSCDVAVRETRVEHRVVLSAPGAELFDESAVSEPHRIAPALLAIPEPVVSFKGPLNLGSVGATANGPVVSALTGTLELTVTGLDRACGDWTLQLAASPLVDDAGDPLPGASLVLVAVGDLPVAGGGCDLSAGCEALEFNAGPQAQPEERIALTIELRVGPDTPLGAFGTTIDATLNVRGSNNG